MIRRLFAFSALACALSLAMAVRPMTAQARVQSLSHVYYIMMENQSFDNVIGRHAAGSSAPYVLDTPFITSLIARYGLETLSFGTTHPSLPNYLSLIAGNYFGIHDDNPSCYAVPKQSTCDKANGKTIADLLEAKGKTWVELEQSMPSAGYLGPQYPTSPTGPVHYAQKHNPFVYFSQIATNKAELAHIIPLNSMSTLSNLLKNPATAPNFTFIVPDQCHDMHGTSDCSNFDALLMEGDKYVRQVVTTIVSSPSFTSDSAIILTWDEDDYSSNIGCCGSLFPIGGGHTATIVITKNQKKPIYDASGSNHYTELAVIETALGLSPMLGKAAGQPLTLFNLMP